MSFSRPTGYQGTPVLIAVITLMVAVLVTLVNVSIVAFGSSTVSTISQSRNVAPKHDEATEVQPHTDRLGAVSSLSSTCSRIGTQTLKSGGNAVDAAIATQFCLGVIGLDLCGLGGGGFALVRSANGSYESVDFRESAPAAAFEDMYKDNANFSLYGGLASGVPGELRGLEYLHKRYGTIPWKQLILPAIEVARKGFTIRTNTVNNFGRLPSTKFLIDDPAWAIDFAPNGTLVGVGDTITRKRYADLLESVGEKGPSTFYSGAIAAATIRTIQKANGSMTLEDLKNYTAISRKPVSIRYRDYKLTSCGAPASGSVVLNMMKTAEGFAGFGAKQLNNISTHRFDEAGRFAYGLRTKLGDPSFVEGVEEYEEGMLSEATAETIRGRISDEHTLPVTTYNPDNVEILETHGTSQLSVGDCNGIAVSLTSTINTNFGSLVIVPETGLILNNEMDDFSVPGRKNSFGYEASPQNFIRPGKRPLSSISPVIVDHLANGTLYYVTGAAGGSKIVTSTAQSLWGILDGNKSSLEAVKEPRFHDQLDPNLVTYEYSFDNATVAFMEDRGHNTSWINILSNVQVVRRLPNGTFEAAAETRQLDSGGFAV